VRSTHRMSFNTDRRLFHGRPRPSFRHFGLGINGSRTFHWCRSDLAQFDAYFFDATTSAYGYF
jgi:hypothetical protein